MHLTIDKVHRIMGQVLGPEAVTLQNYVHRVQEEQIFCGVVIGADGVLYYDPKWWEAHIDTPEKARHVVMAEVLKKLLGADRRSGDWISRVASGAVINAYLYKAYGFHELPRALYSAVELPECLMRPNARGFHSRLHRLYKGIWNREPRFTSIANVEKAMRILFLDTGLISPTIDPNNIPVPGFIHGEYTDGRIDIKMKAIADMLPDDLLEQMAAGVCQTAGYNTVENDFVVKKLKSKKSLETKIVEEFALDQMKLQAKRFIDEPETVETPVPRKLKKRDIINIARGHIPFIFEDEQDTESGEGGLAVYVDVSGSFHSYIPYAMGILECLEGKIDAVYQFSNVIHRTSFQELKSPNLKIATTGGTDFDCVFVHAIDNQFKKIIIVTDGFADITNPSIRERADKFVTDCLFILVSRLPWVEKPSKPGEFAPATDPVRPGNEYQNHFLKSTWVGQRYGMAMDIAKAFR